MGVFHEFRSLAVVAGVGIKLRLGVGLLSAELTQKPISVDDLLLAGDAVQMVFLGNLKPSRIVFDQSMPPKRVGNESVYISQ